MNLDPPWLIELVSLRESKAVKDATSVHGGFSVLNLSTDAEDSKQSEEHEMLTVQGKIAAKAWDRDKNDYVKFPCPYGAIHMIMVDAREFLGTDGPCGDAADWRQIAVGPDGLSATVIHRWTDPQSGVDSPIRGLFEPSCPRPEANAVRERVHVVGFVCEENYTPNEIGKKTVLCCNPALVGEGSAILDAIRRWPLLPRNSRI